MRAQPTRIRLESLKTNTQEALQNFIELEKIYGEISSIANQLRTPNRKLRDDLPQEFFRKFNENLSQLNVINWAVTKIKESIINLSSIDIDSIIFCLLHNTDTFDSLNDIYTKITDDIENVHTQAREIKKNIDPIDTNKWIQRKTLEDILKNYESQDFFLKCFRSQSTSITKLHGLMKKTPRGGFTWDEILKTIEEDDRKELSASIPEHGMNETLKTTSVPDKPLQDELPSKTGTGKVLREIHENLTTTSKFLNERGSSNTANKSSNHGIFSSRQRQETSYEKAGENNTTVCRNFL
ncbi:MAG: hypothetical protein CMF55_01125 [Legionellales bacterium]|nr:hypothetical protein [Legionellales bacterium]HAG62001.1 hypothetical protein [Coxiellaceae bacterium]